MVSVTISIPEETRALMKAHAEINWSAFIRRCINEKVHELSRKEEIHTRLAEEKTFNEWAVKLVREGRQKKHAIGR